MKQILPILIGLLLSAPAWSNVDQSMDEIEKLIRLRDYPQAARRLETLANTGNPEAQYRLASLYRAGKGVGKDLDRATELHHISAMTGYANAQYSLGQLIQKADSSPESLNEAIEWYRKAAAQGHERAAIKLKQLEAYIAALDQGLSRAEIFDAIQRNDIILINSWIESGANLDLTDQLGNSTVMAALLAGWPRLAQTLLDHTTRPAQVNSLGFRPMHVATIRGYKTVAIALLDDGVDIDQTDARGNTALMLAAKNQKTDMLKLLLERGADFTISNRKKQTAVDFVFAADYPTGKALLASYGIGPGTTATAITITEVNVASSLDQFKTIVEQRGGRYTGWPLLNIAIELGEISIAKEIIEQQPELDAVDADGNSAMHVAARKGDSVMLGQLVAHGANLNTTNTRNETALYLAVESTCLKCVKLLLANKADQSIAGKPKITPLEAAIRNDEAEIARALLTFKTSYAGLHRALLMAIQKDMEGLSNTLIKRDSKLDSVDAKQRSVLWHSADRGLEKTSALLVDSGKVNIDGQDSNGHGALAQAIKNGHFAIVQLLINKGADVTIRTKAANTLLMLAVLANNPHIVELLLTRASDVNAQDHVGDTALMLAASTAQNDIVEMLIEAGADTQLRNKEDLNAFQIANNSGHPETAEIIRERSNFVFKLFN
jgi:ankyrin repeat protein